MTLFFFNFKKSHYGVKDRADCASTSLAGCPAGVVQMVLTDRRRGLAMTVDFEDHRRQELRDHFGGLHLPHPNEVERQVDLLLVGGIRAHQRTESSTRGIWATFLGVLMLVTILIFSVMMEFYIAKKREMTLIYESNPLRRQHLLPNQQYKRGDIVIHINQLGLRDNPPQRPKPRCSCRIAVMGGSSVFDIRAGHRASWPSRFSKTSTAGSSWRGKY
jgi:hypothetical protein